MKVTVKYKELQVEFDVTEANIIEWKDEAKEILQQLKEIYKDDSEFEKF